MPGVSGAISGNIDAVQLSHLLGTPIISATSTSLVLSGGGVALTLTGTGLTYDANEQLTGGTVTGIVFTDPEPNSAFGRVLGHIDGVSLPAATLVGWLVQNATTLAFSTIFSGSDLIGGTQGGPDLLRGYDGNDTIQSFDGGPDTVFGGNGDDSIIGSTTSADSLNGGPGADTIAGGGGAFSDLFEVGAGESAASAAAGGALGRIDHITDWTSADILTFTGGGAATANSYSEVTASSFDQAAALAQTNLAQGTEYTVAQVGSDVIVFDLRVADAVVLTNRTLADISLTNIVGRASPLGASGATVDLFDGSDMGTFQESFLSDATVTRSPTEEHLTFAGGTATMSITGVGLTYDSAGALSGGTVTGLEVTSANGRFVLAGAHTDGAILGQAYHTGDSTLSISSLLSGNDVITVRSTTPPATDTSFTGMGWGGNDLMVGGGSLSTLYGGDGNDTVQAGGAASSYLRGDNGDDSVSGGVGFDDINGNQGNDTAHGNAGNDWVVGGKDNDILFGDAGDDIVWGNLGNDTLDGGDGADQVRGGQGDDIVNGGGGNDYVSGDRGNDTITGGSGADIFHDSQDAGIDRVLDFNLTEGDRVMLDPGTTFTVGQVGADTIIDMGGGNQMILVGVQASSLPAGTIFLG